MPARGRSVDDRGGTSPRRGPLLAAVGAVALLALMALDTKAVAIGSAEDARVQAFSPEAWGAAEFPRIQGLIVGAAVDAATLAAAIAADKAAAVAQYGRADSQGPVFAVTLTGVAGEPRLGVYPVAVAGLPEGLGVRVQTGPAINGTEVRDATGTVAFGQFKNQIEFQDAGSALNNQVKALVLAPVDTGALAGRTITVTGVFRLVNPKAWLVTPLALSVAP